MDQDRWKTVNQIFHAALEVSSAERPVFVETASNGDKDMQAEVELLLQADRDAASYLESPANPAALFLNSASSVNAGDVLCGRFRILRAVGEGGMGHVFEALDSELAVHVALKIIRSEIASNPEALARFRQEVRLARRITHPNVCRTFDLEREIRVVDPKGGNTQEVVFLTMEFLEGETLASRIKRAGPLPLDESLNIAQQIADALRAAHALGIVHRDIKPANIMLVPVEAPTALGFRAVITDFGLARLDPVISSGNLSGLSHTARPIGTLAYMAPEQLENGQVSPATDIYSFGLVLFEMVTGTRAFRSDNFLSGVAHRLNGPPPSPRSIVPGLPVPWRRAIEGCLRLRPADRFHSAADAMAVLAGSRVALPRIANQSLVKKLTFASRPLQRRLLVIATFFIVAVALVVGTLRLYRSSADPKVTPGALVYLTQVKNQTGDKTFDNLTELIQAGLTQSAQINLLDRGRVGDILQQMTKAPDTAITERIAREIAMRAGAVRVVFATVTGSSGSYSLNVDIQQPDNTPTRYRDHWTRSLPWHASGSTTSSSTIPPELLTAIRTSSDWIRLEVGESANDIVRLDAPPEDVTTGNWEALAAYATAERMVAAHQRGRAVDALTEAVKIDPAFAMAYARLGDVLYSLLRDDEGYQAYRKALDVNLQERLTRRERDRIRGMIALDTGDEQSAEAAFRDYATYYESDYSGWFFRAYPLMMLGRTPEAIETLRRAYAIDPSRLSAPAHLARYSLILDNLPEAWKWQRWISAHGFLDDANFVAGQIEMVAGRYDAAEQSFRSMLRSSAPDYQSLGASLLARFYAERGNQAQALATLNDGITSDSAHGFAAHQAAKLIDRAYVRCRTLDFAGAPEDIRSALRLNPGLQTLLSASSVLGQCKYDSSGPGAENILFQLAVLDKSLPKPDDSLLWQGTAFRVRGELQLARGEWKRALQEFQKADSIEPTASDREYLARAYLVASKLDADVNERAKYRSHALALYIRLANQEAVTWIRMLELPPGTYADNLEHCLNLAMQAHSSPQTLNRLRDLQYGLRGHDLSHKTVAGFEHDHPANSILAASTQHGGEK